MFITTFSHAGMAFSKVYKVKLCSFLSGLLIDYSVNITLIAIIPLYDFAALTNLAKYLQIIILEKLY